MLRLNIKPFHHIYKYKIWLYKTFFNTFILQGIIKLIKRDSKNIYNATKKSLFQINATLVGEGWKGEHLMECILVCTKENIDI